MIELKEVSKKFGSYEVFNNISFKIPKDKITVILGESGCGKTTLLNLISDNIKDYEGSITFNTELQNIAYVYQEDILIPWLTVKKNIAYVLKNKLSHDELEKVIDRNLKLVGLEEFSNHYPEKLSSGMKKRVGIARAFSYPAELILMDEPFEYLDIKIKNEIIDVLLDLKKEMNRTVVLVSHDIDLAARLAEHIIILSKNTKTIKTIISDLDLRKSTEDLENLRKKIKEILYLY